MEIIVGSKYLAVEINCALDVKGREHLVVIAKSTWQIPGTGQRPKPLPPQPIEQSDIFAGDPENSPMLYGSDMARFKPRCDVIFNASAHSPDGLPAREIDVAWQVGPLRKGLKAHGPRHWKKRLGMVSLSSAEPVTSTPLHFGFALGGSRQYKKAFSRADAMLTESHPANPAGIGWYGSRATDEIDGAPAPSLEALDDPVRKPHGNQAPIAFSAIARHWLPRPRYGGTYDEHWEEEVFPFLPDDFDEQFHQCAPVDQQMPYPVGGEAIVLRNMMAGRPDVRFKLPKLDAVKVQILRHDYSADTPEAVADTLYFEPDQMRFSVVWRTCVPINRRVQEFKTIAVGPVNTEWWHQKTSGNGGCGNCG
ncbi:DUF2169 domain-containing protein [Massilia sp. CCM 8695]|uniref:DUF2169 domain-containing protein n=1 Tax=Massilia frigida TaxID=2609281 RepID=A0ABX0NDK4_9BURK|nr:DUF2169 domain-containing protein [Massilia frigida]NHZ83535.1 DUF2169 domain-containing protein [Massilia frigida]